MTMKLAGNASTQSRSRRPLPPGAVSAVTLGHSPRGVHEIVEFTYADETAAEKNLLSWIGGQSGLLWASGTTLPFDFKSLHRRHGSYGHASEHALADTLGTVYDGLLSSNDMAVRFFQNGSDACSAAARIARAATGRDVIATSGYHGAHLDFVHEPETAGVPKVVWKWKYDEKPLPPPPLHQPIEWGQLPLDSEPAMLMVEVPAIDDDAEVTRVLQVYRDWCDENGAVFVIDDVVLGFRLALAGSPEYYGVKPDMVCLGKAMSATGCVSAVVGRADLVEMLDTEVFYSTTFGGAPGPVSVANATVRWLTENRRDVYGTRYAYNHPAPTRRTDAEKDGHLRRIGRALRDGLHDILADSAARAIGQPERFIVEFWDSGVSVESGEQRRREWCGKMIERGVMADRPFFPTLVHTMADVEETLDAAREVADG